MLKLNEKLPSAPSGERQESDSALGLILFAILVMAAYMMYKAAFQYSIANFGIQSILIISAIVALISSGIRYDSVPKSFRVLIRTIGVVALLYVYFGRTDFSSEILNSTRWDYVWFDQIFYATCILGVIGLVFRFSFIILPLNYILYYKLFLVDVWSVAITRLDYFTVLETGSLLILVPILWSSSQFVLRKLRLTTFTTNLAYSKDGYIEYAILVAIALHFGNYYISAIAKMNLGDSLYFWALYNPTEYLMLAAIDNGVMPLSFSEPLMRNAYANLSFLRPLSNTATLVGQFICVIAIMRISWSLLITVFYDIMHIAIAVVSGIFFWKFIAMNAAIVASLRFMTLGPLKFTAQLLLICCVLLSNRVVDTGVFAWLDTRSFNQYRFFALTDKGEELEVPSNYFLGLSITPAQNRIAWPKSGSFITQTWGTTHNLDTMRKANRCELGVTDGVTEITSFYYPQEWITKVMQKHHKQILSMVDEHGYVNYDLYPHHIFSVPWKFASFKQLDKRKIVSYRFVAEAVCLSMEEDGLRRQVKSSNSFVIPLVNTP